MARAAPFSWRHRYTFAFSCAFPSAPWPAYGPFLGAVLSGLAECVFGIAQFAALYALLPNNGSRPAFFAITQLILLGAATIFSLVAVAFLELYKGTEWVLGSVTLGPFNIRRALSALYRRFLPARR